MSDTTYLAQLHFMGRSFFRWLLVAEVHRIDVLLGRYVFFVLTIGLSAGIHSVVILFQAIVSEASPFFRLGFSFFGMLAGIIRF